jgi:hypothetical protein
LKNGALGDYLNLKINNRRIEKNGMCFSVIFKQAIAVVFEYDINKTYKNKSRQTLLIIYQQQHVSAL